MGINDGGSGRRTPLNLLRNFSAHGFDQWSMFRLINVFTFAPLIKSNSATFLFDLQHDVFLLISHEDFHNIIIRLPDKGIKLFIELIQG